MRKATIRVRVRYAETDRMAYLHHSRYFVYFEEARLELLRQLGASYRELEDGGYLLVVVEASCRYLKPVGYDEVLSVEVTLEKATRARLWHSYRVLRSSDQALVAEGRTLVGCVSPQGKPRRLPQTLLEKLA